MKRCLFIITATFACLAITAANRSWTLSQSTCTSAAGAESPWSFNSGFTITDNASKKLAFGNDNGLKYSVGVQYTINIPDGESIKRVTFSGYDNYAETDAYLAELGGKQYGATDYVWPMKDGSGNTTTVSHTIILNSPAVGTLTFTPQGKQVVWRITLYNYLEEEVPVASGSQMEKLDRGLIAMPAKGGKGNFVSWRLLGTEKKTKTKFDLLRDGQTIAEDLTVSNYTDYGGSSSSSYQVVTKVGGTPTETSAAVTPWDDVYKKLTLDRPAAGSDYTYSPNDCSVGDVDGDGQYELFVKWDPSNSKDNSQSGKTGNVYIDCYRLDGTKLWRVNLGPNIRAGAHYTQFMVYDFDGDGKAEMMCKTAPGAKDGNGAFVSAAASDSEISSTDNSKSYRNSSGYVLSGPEYLTVFDGLSGCALHTVFYNPNRAGSLGGAPSHPDKSFWGDNYGNRCDRYLGAVAFVDGPTQTPAAIFCRGYYTRAYVWAVKFDGSQLTTKWLHASTSKSEYTVTDANGQTTTYTPGTATSGSGSKTMYGNGNHNLSVADVDGDGCDEILWGSAALNHDGKLLYATGFGHGDAIHLADHNPDRAGLEVFQVHEEKGTYSWDLHDAATGEIIFKGGNSGVDNGRGMAAQLSDSDRGSWFSSSDERQQRSAVTGEVAAAKNATVNFRIYWDDDLQEELLDGNVIDEWTGSAFSRLFTVYNSGPGGTCNSTKKTPNLQADILGDWREELVLWGEEDDNCVLAIYSTNIPSPYLVPTLMHDHVYRMGVAWQNTAYNQPPHLGYYLPDMAEIGAEIDDDDDTEGLEVQMEQDYESAQDATSWVSANAQDNLTLETGDAVYGKFIQFAPGNANDRSCYTLLSSGSYEDYILEFDASMKPGNDNGHRSELAIMTDGGFYGDKNGWNINFAERNDSANFLLRLQNGGASSTEFTINCDEENIVTIPSDTWCHYRLKVDSEARTVEYKIKNGNTVIAKGTYNLPEATSTQLKGIYYLSNRYNGVFKFDNFKISTVKVVEPEDTDLTSEVEVTIGDTGYATLSSDYPLDLDVEDLEAYVVESVDGNSVKLAAVSSVPSGTGLLLKGTPATAYRLPVSASEPSGVGDNLLVAVTSDYVADGSNQVYVLAKKKYGVGFYPVSQGVTIPAGKAYLRIEGGNSREYFPVNGESTAITTLAVPAASLDGPVYDLQGRRVMRPSKGVYLMPSGRKVIITK